MRGSSSPHHLRTSFSRWSSLDLTLLAVGVVLLVVAAVATRHVGLRAAVDGFSPAEFVYKRAHPEWFVKDFPSGVEQYAASAPMRMYEVAYELFGVDPTDLQTVYVAVEVLLAAGVTFVLGRTLLPQAPPGLLAIIVIFFLTGNLRQPDLGRWGQPLFYGLYYVLADTSRILGIVQVLRGRLFSAALLFGLSFAAHPIMALAGITFAGATLLADRHRQPLQGLLVSIALFTALATGWLLFALDIGALARDQVPTRDWVSLTLLNNVHFYPVEFGTFGAYHYENLLPLLSLLLLAILGFDHPAADARVRQQVIAGFLAIAVLVTLGILFSHLKSSPLLIRMALHRSDDLVVSFAAVYAIAALWQRFLTAHTTVAVLAAVALTTPFMVPSGVPLLFALLLAAAELLAARLNRSMSTRHYMLLALSAGALLLLLTYAALGMLLSWSTPAYTGFDSLGGTPWGATLAAVGMVVLAVLVRRRPINRSVAAGVGIALVVLSAVQWQWSNRPYPKSSKLARAQDYKAVQDWARTSTPTGTLFMPVPTHYYGWRHFSQRPSFGNLREWLMTAWFYSSDAASYREGMRRFAEFDIALEPFLKYDRPIDGFSELNLQVARFYYNGLSSQRLTRLNATYGVEYAVFEKRFIQSLPELPVAYQNASYLVLALSPTAGGFTAPPVATPESIGNGEPAP